MYIVTHQTTELTPQHVFQSANAFVTPKVPDKSRRLYWFSIDIIMRTRGKKISTIVVHSLIHKTDIRSRRKIEKS